MDDHVSRILKMLEEGKINADQAAELIKATTAASGPSATSSTTQAGTSSTQPRPESRQKPEGTETTGEGGPSKSFEFQWGQKKSFPFDLSNLGRQISDAVKRVDPEKIVREAQGGILRGGRRWQERMRQWSRFMEGEDGRPENTLNQPTARKSETRTFELPPDAMLHIENNWGAVSIQGGASQVTLEIECEAWAATQEEAESRVGSLTVDTQTPPTGEGAPARLEVRVTAPDDWCDGTANLTLRVPDAARAQVQTTFGEVRLENLEGRVEAHTMSGKTLLENLRGEARAESMSGDIAAANVTGEINLASRSGNVLAEKLAVGGVIASVSGDVTARAVEGGRIAVKSVSGDATVEDAGTTTPADIALETVSGDATLRRSRGSIFLKAISGEVTAEDVNATTLQAETVSGDVRLGMSSAFSGTLTTNTVSGDVNLRLPQDSSVRFTLGTHSGQLSCSLPTQPGTRTDTLWTGAVGSGQGTVTVQTRSGDVVLG